MSVKTRLLPRRCCQFSFFPFFSPQRSFWWLPEMPITSLILSLSLHLLAYPSPAVSLSLPLLPDTPTFIIYPFPSPSCSLSINRTDYPQLLWHPFFSLSETQMIVLYSRLSSNSEINKPDANVKMPRSQTSLLWSANGLFTAHFMHVAHKMELLQNPIWLALHNFREFVYTGFLLNSGKQSPVYKFTDFFNGPRPKNNLLVDLPKFVTYMTMLCPISNETNWHRKRQI